ncbi:NAAT family transporter [Gloeocapsopsis crepidinum LEGE 06123]|uniref:UPF0056 membrane protein n=1 Tax=Gloeocapsopsis crepidinum LEGE 06123 TaxID=588587 RepID=A0ABR9UUW1_9CHRO|nr:MarC family protein [Gloeocapsopsis crepidinum]MBE9192082.1 NAAT family transporter [Gloeocapsopsis crepidinum LEGE 06123]
MWQQLTSAAIGTFLTLFPVTNPVGAIPIFYGLTAVNTKLYRLHQARQTAINVVLILGVFLLAGREILSFFGISLGVLRIAGGLLIAHTAWEMVTARQRLTRPESDEAVDKEDISFTPMAIPMISGPGAIGVVIGFAASNTRWVDDAGCLLGIVLLGVTIYLCLALGEPLVGVLGKNGLGALNRVLGFFILAIAVQFVADGTFSLLREAAPSLLR